MGSANNAFDMMEIVGGIEVPHVALYMDFNSFDQLDGGNHFVFGSRKPE